MNNDKENINSEGDESDERRGAESGRISNGPASELYRRSWLTDAEILALLPEREHSRNAQHFPRCVFNDGQCRSVSAQDCQGLCVQHFCELYRKGQVDITNDAPTPHMQIRSRKNQAESSSDEAILPNNDASQSVTRETTESSSEDPVQQPGSLTEASGLRTNDQGASHLGGGDARQRRKYTVPEKYGQARSGAQYQRLGHTAPDRGSSSSPTDEEGMSIKCSCKDCDVMIRSPGLCESCDNLLSEGWRQDGKRKKKRKCVYRECKMLTNTEGGLCDKCNDILRRLQEMRTPQAGAEASPTRRGEWALEHRSYPVPDDARSRTAHENCNQAGGYCHQPAMQINISVMPQAQNPQAQTQQDRQDVNQVVRPRNLCHEASRYPHIDSNARLESRPNAPRDFEQHSNQTRTSRTRDTSPNTRNNRSQIRASSPSVHDQDYDHVTRRHSRRGESQTAQRGVPSSTNNQPYASRHNRVNRDQHFHPPMEFRPSVYSTNSPERFHATPSRYEGLRPLDIEATTPPSSFMTGTTTFEDTDLFSFISQVPRKCKAAGCEQYGNEACRGYCNECYSRNC